jgi:PAS domain S-box-containing protein
VVTAGESQFSGASSQFLAEQSAGFQNIVEQARNGIVVIDRSGEILVFNKVARQIVEKRADQVYGKHMKDVLPDAWQDMQPIFTGGQTQIGRKVSVGSNVIIANRTPIFFEDKVVGILSVFQDIADYEKIVSEMETYKHLHEELDVIINSSYDGLWISDAQGRVVRVNRASEKMSGIKEADVLGRSMSELVSEGLFDKSATLEVLRNKTAVTLIQTLQDGRQVLVTGNPVLDSTGNIRLVVVNARDISELNRLHAELEESRALNFQYSSELNYIQQFKQFESEIVVRSAAMQRIFEKAMRIARVESSVLITGESGTGKSLIADVIHRASNRAGGSLIQINCGAIPESLIEAELFGYEQGAFTGARSQGKPGYFEMAHGGTLLLDEVGELPLNVQVKLLRFLENNQVVRVGATTPRKLDVRVVAATNRDLESMVNAGTFRKDLFFRLNVVPLKIPPLRKRADDIPPLIHFFLKQFNAKCHTDKSLSPAALDCLRNFSYPGNIRELANLIEQLVVLTPTDRIGLEDLPAAVRQNEPDPCLFPETEWNLGNVVQGVEKNLIINALKACGSQRQAAKLLNIDHSTLSRKIKRYKIDHGAIIHHGENMQNSPMPSIPGQP